MSPFFHTDANSQSTVIIQFDVVHLRHLVNTVIRNTQTAASIIVFWSMVQCSLVEGFLSSVGMCLQNSTASHLTGLYNFSIPHYKNLQSQTNNNLEKRIISHSWNECLCVANQEDFLLPKCMKHISRDVFQCAFMFACAGI